MDKIKAGVVALFGFLSSALGVLFIPVCLLVGCNIIDYVTGLMATPSRDEKISSYKSIKGIMKKVAMWLLVLVGAIIDQLIKYSVDTIGLNFPFTFLIACVVAIWLICNELISILENIADIGTPLPAFLGKIVHYIKDQAEMKVDMDDNKDSEDVK
ncbi:phage holin family protein [Clostridioides difficile]|nr:phage holin family protein [Clostridioides difficile]